MWSEIGYSVQIWCVKINWIEQWLVVRAWHYSMPPTCPLEKQITATSLFSTQWHQRRMNAPSVSRLASDINTLKGKSVCCHLHREEQSSSQFIRLASYLLILWAHLGQQHGHVVSVPHPGVTGEILQDHHGFVQASDCLHHPVINDVGRRRTRRQEPGVDIWWWAKAERR